jgi:predicted lactoylglutathione lyase
MTKDIWLNLPVKSIERSKQFYKELGFSFSTGPGDTEDSACLIVGEKELVIMLFEDTVFKGIVQNNIADANQSSEVLFSISAESRLEVDEMTKQADSAGAKVFCEPVEIHGTMYGSGFADPDGHRWNLLFMEPASG